MGGRDLILIAMVGMSLPLIFWRPYTGILVWSWLSYMNPHRLTYGIAYGLPFAQTVAITLFLALLFSSEKKRIPVNTTTIVWGLFIGWMGISTLFAIYPDAATQQYIKIIKIQLVTVLTIMLINDRQRLDQLIWVIVLSIGFYSTKGGIFTIMTGGAFRVWGPFDSFIQENNALALATLMVIPLMVYLYQLNREKPWLRVLLGSMIALSLVSALGSQSRGAFVAVLAVGGFFWLKTRGKILSGIGIVFAGVILVGLMPQSWHDRMSSITNYQQDASAMGRINAWQYSINVASDRITGAGLESWTRDTFAVWAPIPEKVHAAHSIYFSALGDHGWPGLCLFLLVLFLTWRHLRRIERETYREAGDDSFTLLSRCLQVSFVAYLSGGAFLSLTYFDLPWHMIAMTIIMMEIRSRDRSQTATQDEPDGAVDMARRVGFQTRRSL